MSNENTTSLGSVLERARQLQIEPPRGPLDDALDLITDPVLRQRTEAKLQKRRNKNDHDYDALVPALIAGAEFEGAPGVIRVAQNVVAGHGSFCIHIGAPGMPTVEICGTRTAAEFVRSARRAEKRDDACAVDSHHWCVVLRPHLSTCVDYFRSKMTPGFRLGRGATSFVVWMFRPKHGLTPLPRALVDRLLAESEEFRNAILKEVVREVERPR